MLQTTRASNCDFSTEPLLNPNFFATAPGYWSQKIDEKEKVIQKNSKKNGGSHENVIGIANIITVYLNFFFLLFIATGKSTKLSIQPK